MLTHELPIYRDTYNLMSLVIDYVALFPKSHRYTIGQKLTNVSLELFEYLSLANRAGPNNKERRVKMLEGFMIKFELIRVLIRLCSEKRIMSIKQLSRISELIEKIERQATGWKNK